MEIINDVELAQKLTLDQSFKYAKLCSSLLRTQDNIARKLIINILNNWHKIPESTFDIWTDLIESAGFYPYLQKNKEFQKLDNLPGQIRKELHLSKNLPSKYLHEEQLELLKLLNSDKNVIVSAPTSFGKSLLIEEAVASKQYKNIVIIQPTLALLDETRRKLVKYKDSYKIIVRTSQEPSNEKGNVFLFTAERVNEYQFFQKIDFLVIDEFYKLSGNRDDERSSPLNTAFHYALTKFNPKFYLLGPNIDGISDGFSEKYNAVFFKSHYSLVDSRSIDIYKNHVEEFGVRGHKKAFKEITLFKLLYSLKDEQNIIYCSSPNRVRFLAKEFTRYLIENKSPITKEEYPIIEWIENYIHEDWSVLKNIMHDIGIHDGALQKHISTSIIDYFNKGQLKFLFCTSTIIEGVNTSAKNIIYFDETKGGANRKIDFFDYSNIKGRAGRMMEHYIGKIYNFNKPPENKSIIIDIPFFEQKPIKDEVLIQLDEKEIINKNSEQYQKLSQLPTEERQLIKKNGVNVHGQKSIIDLLRNDINDKYNLIKWESAYPTKSQLTYVLSLAWNHLLIEGETTRPMTLAKLITMTSMYGFNQDIDFLIKNDYKYLRSLPAHKLKSNSEVLDLAIQETFQIIKHWFEYKVPKWLSVINELQKFVCLENGLRPGNYSHYANLIENDFLRGNLAILAEFGIPGSAIRKLESDIPENINQDEILDYIKNKSLHKSNKLLDYERKKIEENL
ncbi:MAG: DEAD/DEAH box helicase [Bacteroidota bacterium]|nr:DEAD/DEAH box helicase [Bacteroidota bacterium]